MVRIAGINMPPGKHVWIALTSVYGIGRSRAYDICRAVSVNPETRVQDLQEDQITELRSATAEYTVEGDLRRDVALSIKSLMSLGNYRGVRHRRRLPLRGQRTRTNARTRKGPRRPVK